MSGADERRRALAEALAAVRDRLVRACEAAGRPPHEVELVAVTKTWPLSDVLLLRELGVTRFGENRDAEAAEKAAGVREAGLGGIRWHFVGQVQSRKARSVASYADVVESVDRLRLVEALADGARQAGRQVEVLLQVSLDGDPSRGGAQPAEVPEVAAAVVAAGSLRLRGVMAVAPLGDEPASAFARLREVAEELRAAHPGADVISAGMSGDLEAAVAAGSTSVRVGTALLGRRPPHLL